MTDTQVPPVPLVSGVLEAALYVGDLDRAVTFYGGVLGLEQIQRVGERHVFFRAGQTIVLIFNPVATAEPPRNPDLPVPPHGASGPGHICFATEAHEFSDWIARFNRAGVAVEADFHWPNGARSLYVRDPDGNSVEFAEPWLWTG
ncbi:MAG: VOC family protein [Pseudomonadota bacterium]